jgi:uncharacterized repeat protein (TIGR02543 family)
MGAMAYDGSDVDPTVIMDYEETDVDVVDIEPTVFADGDSEMPPLTEDVDSDTNTTDDDCDKDIADMYNDNEEYDIDLQYVDEIDTDVSSIDEIFFDIQAFAAIDTVVTTSADTGYAAEVAALLNDNVTNVINITDDVEILSDIVLQRNKIINNPGFFLVTIVGNITGGFTLTANGHLNIEGTFDCSINLPDEGYVGINNNLATLNAGRTLTIGGGGLGDPASMVFVNSAFINNGNIVIGGVNGQLHVSSLLNPTTPTTFINNGNITVAGKMYIGEGSIFSNSGTVSLSWYYYARLTVEGTFDNNGGTVNNGGRIDVLDTGTFQMPTTLSNADGLITGVSGSNFSGDFIFLTFDANGGNIFFVPTAVMAESRGSVFDLTKFIWGVETPTDLAFSGWFTERVGGTRIDLHDTTAFDGAGRTLYAQYVELTTAAELIEFLEESGDGTFVLKTYPNVFSFTHIFDNIILGGNKTIIARDASGSVARVTINGNISGDFTLTMQNSGLAVIGEIDCNITLIDTHFGNVGTGESTLLKDGRTIDASRGSFEPHTNFENRGTIIVSYMEIRDITFTNSGTVIVDAVRVFYEVEGEEYYWINHGRLSIGGNGEFNDNGGTVINKGTIDVGGNGLFEMPFSFTTNEGIIYGARRVNLSGAFDFLTLNANGGHFGWLGWQDMPTTTAVVAVPSGAMFDLTLFDRIQNMWRDGDNDIWYRFTGWYTTATGGDLIDMENTIFNGAEQTFFAHWQQEVYEDIGYWWPTEEEINDLIDSAAGSGVISVELDETTTELSIGALIQINDAEQDIGLSFAIPNGSTFALDAKALATLVDQLGEIGAGHVSLSLNLQGQSAIAALPDEQKSQIKQGDAVFSIKLTADNGELISEFGDGRLTITLPWEGRFPAIVWYLAEDGTLSRMETTSDPIAKTVTFTTNHLSIYIIREAPDVIITTTTPPGGAPKMGDYRTLLLPGLLIAMGLLGLGGWVFYNKRNKKAAK